MKSSRGSHLRAAAARITTACRDFLVALRKNGNHQSNIRYKRMTTKNGFRRAVAVMMLVMAACGAAFAADKGQCVSGDRIINRVLSGFTISISRYHDALMPSEFLECRAQVRDANQHIVFSVHEPALRQVTAGEDLNGDGIPDLVLEGDSGGNAGDYTYYVISLGKSPGLLLKFCTGSVPAKFGRRDDSGHVTIQTWDGAFFMFDHMATAFSPYPDVYLQLDGKRLVDISDRHKADYDKSIKSLRSKLTSRDFARFRAIDQSWEKSGEEEAASIVLKISLGFLYSGREREAYETILAMWPVFDQQRIWKSMLNTRNNGILKQVSNRPLKKQ
jgi:hypothetical protein